MKGKYKRIGISGGTFDPIHHGHLIVAEEVRQKFELDRMLFIPVGLPPHKDNLTVTPAEHRFNMVNEAVSTNPHFEASRIEIDRKGYTYTIDTLTLLKSVYGDDTQIFFMVGADVVKDLLTWKDFRKVFSICTFIAAFRPGADRSEYNKEINDLRSEYRAKIEEVQIPLIEISSTAIRQKVKEGKSVKYLIPDGVEKYIMKNGLYK